MKVHFNCYPATGRQKLQGPWADLSRFPKISYNLVTNLARAPKNRRAAQHLLPLSAGLAPETLYRVLNQACCHMEETVYLDIKICVVIQLNFASLYIKVYNK